MITENTTDTISEMITAISFFSMMTLWIVHLVVTDGVTWGWFPPIGAAAGIFDLLTIAAVM